MCEFIAESNLATSILSNIALLVLSVGEFDQKHMNTCADGKLYQNLNGNDTLFISIYDGTMK